jgi:hypothetical protein
MTPPERGNRGDPSACKERRGGRGVGGGGMVIGVQGGSGRARGWEHSSALRDGEIGREWGSG